MPCLQRPHAVPARLLAAICLCLAVLGVGAAEVPGANGPVLTIRRVGTNVYVGGGFTRIGGVEARGIACWDGTRWNALADATTNGVDGEVSALLEGPDGSVLVGGAFTTAGGVSCGNLARWTGSAWLAQSRFDGRVLCLEWRTDPNEPNLLVGGAFGKVDGQPASPLVVLRRREGGEWGDLRIAYPADGPVVDLRRHGLDVWLVGGFSRLKGVVAGLGRITRGDFELTPVPEVSGVGTALARGLGSAEPLLVGGGELRYTLGGRANGLLSIPVLTSSPAITAEPGLEGGAAVDRGNPSTREIHAILALQGQVLVGGRFRSAGGRLVSNLALWDGRDWASTALTVGGGVDGVVRTLEWDGERLWVGGEFSRADHRPAANLAVVRLSGPQAVWEFPGTGPLPEEPAPAGEDRFRVVAGLNGSVSHLAAGAGEVLAMGTFTRTSGDRPVRGLGTWNGSEWRDLGPLTFRSGTQVLDGFAYRMVAGHGRIYMGGVFTHIGGVAATNIAYREGGRWHPLGGGIWNGFGVTTDYLRQQVAAIVPHETGVFVGGNFMGGGAMADADRTRLYNVARYSFADGRWHALGGGLHGGFNNSVQVSDMAVWGGHVYVSGFMTQYEQPDGSRGGVVRSLTRWSLADQEWSAVPLEGLPAFFDATTLAATTDHLYVGGTTLGIYRWDGRAWSVVLPRVPNVAQRIWDMLPYHQDLYVVTTSTVDGFHLRRWRAGVWGDLSSGLFGFPTSITCIAARDNTLFFGGQFDRAGGLPVSNFGVADISPRTYDEFRASRFGTGGSAGAGAPGEDADGDGLSNEAEYLAGTDPTDPGIAFRTTGLTHQVEGANPPGFFRPGGAVISFEAMPNRTYGVESREASDAPWVQFARVESRPVPRTEQVRDGRPGAVHRFYRVVTPARGP